MSGRLVVDTSKFNAMVKQIAAKAGVPHEEVLVHEVGKVLEATLKFTPAATVGGIRSSSENANFSAQPESLYTPASGRGGVNVTKKGFIAYYLRNRYPDALWSLIEARRKASLIAKLKARGLSKLSWLRLAQKLGISIDYPGYVESAVPSTGKQYPEDTFVRIQRQTGKLQIAIQNSQPTVNKIGGGRAFQRAIDGRYKFFLQNMARSVFNDIKTIAKRYPGMKVT